MKEKLIIIGAGPHAKVIIDIIKENETYEIIGCLDHIQDNKNEILNIPIIGDDSLLISLFNNGIKNAFIALGNNQIRHTKMRELEQIGFKLINAISKHARISNYVTLGYGIAIMPGVTINVGATIGNNTVINTNASVDHDVVIGESAHIAPGVAISGSTHIGIGTFIGTGSSIRDGISIGDWTTIGVGSAVIRNIPSYSIAYGVPAKVMRKV